MTLIRSKKGKTILPAQGRLSGGKRDRGSLYKEASRWGRSFLLLGPLTMRLLNGKESALNCGNVRGRLIYGKIYHRSS